MSGATNHNDDVLQVAGHGLLRPSVRVDGRGISKPTYLDELIFYSLLHYASLPTSSPLLRPIGDLLPYVPIVRDMWFITPLPDGDDGSVVGGGGHDVNNLLQVLMVAGASGVKEVSSTIEDNEDATVVVPLLVAKYYDAARLAACKAANILPTSPAALKDGCWYIDMLNEVVGMEAPCVIDIKVGKIRSSPSSGASGVRKEAKDIGTTAKSIGLRLSGARHMILNTSGDMLESTIGIDKTFGRELTDTTFAAMLRVFCTTSLSTTTMPPTSEGTVVANDDPPISSSSSSYLFADLTNAMGSASTSTIKCDMSIMGNGSSSSVFIQQVCTTRLRGLVSTLRAHPAIMASLCILSSSVMIAYDCAEMNRNIDRVSTSSSQQPAVVVKLIDFARSGPRREHYPEVDGVDFVNSLERLASLLDTA